MSKETVKESGTTVVETEEGVKHLVRDSKGSLDPSMLSTKIREVSEEISGFYEGADTIELGAQITTPIPKGAEKRLEILMNQTEELIDATNTVKPLEVVNDPGTINNITAPQRPIIDSDPLADIPTKAELKMAAIKSTRTLETWQNFRDALRFQVNYSRDLLTNDKPHAAWMSLNHLLSPDADPEPEWAWGTTINHMIASLVRKLHPNDYEDILDGLFGFHGESLITDED